MLEFKAVNAEGGQQHCLSHTNLLLLIITEQPSTDLFTDFKCLIFLVKMVSQLQGQGQGQ